MTTITNYGWDAPLTTRIFDDFVKEWPRRINNRVNTWAPAMDVHENDKEFLGIKKEEIHVDIRDNALVISGETKQEQKFKEGNTHVQERRYGSFSRSISLPPNVKHDDISAKFENGLLELTLPKAAPTGKKITIA
ncbi:3474_t:CDS:2 [Funneliformis geosporum]|uniref:10261_t:CDS:1 n=1 Tax=Funneliformis geosporum TaxID=1117311 RepID=A0A9W4SS08_9GLOM|nr:10261_t:CDS:2 [Funneliformis geosporum]CAI2180205.1 3474_t:CDS:2 [Funneliformis geosporum]